MNKVVLLLGVIVFFTLAIVFFSVGFFAGYVIIPGDGVTATHAAVAGESSAASTGGQIAVNNLASTEDVASLTISNRIGRILSTATDGKSTLFGLMSGGKNKLRNLATTPSKSGASSMTVESLLREIAATHDANDDCSYERTLAIGRLASNTPESLIGKRVVFMGYFRNENAAHIQRLLTSRGYKVHATHSRGNSDESLVFSGPFAEEENANQLARWLREHDFNEVKVVSITRESKHPESILRMKNNAENIPLNRENPSVIAIYGNNIPGQNNQMLNASQVPLNLPQ